MRAERLMQFADVPPLDPPEPRVDRLPHLVLRPGTDGKHVRLDGVQRETLAVVEEPRSLGVERRAAHVATAAHVDV